MILVTGASGFIGRYLVARLAADGLPVRVLAAPHRARGKPSFVDASLWPESVEVMAGLLSRPADLHQALTDVYTVFHLASAQWWGRRRQLEQIDLGGTQAIVAAAKAARIGRLILLSHLGAAPSSAFMLLRAKGLAEELVRSSGLAYTIVRSGIVFGEEDRFFNGIALLIRANPFLFIQPGEGETLLHPLFIYDLVEALRQCLDRPETVDQILEIGGPEYHTYNEIVRTVMRVTGTSRTIVTLPPYLMRTITGITLRAFPAWPVTGQWYDLLAGNRTAPLGALENTFHIAPSRLEDTLVGYMAKRRYMPLFLRTLARRRAH